MKRGRVLFLSAIAAVCFATTGFAQMPAYTKVGPLPPELATAKTIFVSNGGSSDNFMFRVYGGDPYRAYTEFYSALKATGDFTLAPDPGQADLVLELSLIHHSFNYEAASFQLVIYERKTHYVLWTITRSIEFAARISKDEKNFDIALSEVLDQFLQITGKAPAPGH